MKYDQNVLFRCPDELRKTLSEYAQANYLTMSQVVRKALREFFERLERDGE